MAKSNMIGRAFEYICIHCLEAEISKVRPVQVITNDNYIQDMNDWNALDAHTQSIMQKEALAAIPTIIVTIHCHWS